MKFLLTVLLAVGMICSGYSQVGKALHKTITVEEGITQLQLDLAGSVEVKATKSSRILIEVKVRLEETTNDRLLEYLVNSGRYDFIQRIDKTTGTLTVANKKNNNVVMVKGKECKETFEYIIHVPENIQYVESTTTASND
ncbi:MAG: hypothetical protein GY810_08255 [Aureispira sp.]|nr:hypothetical protein [Aureispira sp.]